MAEAPRLRLSDLVTEFLLHDNRRHVFVEGRDDRAVIEWFLESSSINDVQVQEIDSVEITAEDLCRHDLNESNKSRVHILSREFESALKYSKPKIMCIVDADFDFILDRVENNKFLAYTDEASLEMYAYFVEPLNRILKLGLKNFEGKADQVLDDLEKVLHEVFLVRAVNEELQLGLNWLSFERKCNISADGTVTFDAEKFVSDYLNKNGSSTFQMELNRFPSGAAIR